jgi:hypothetical protein
MSSITFRFNSAPCSVESMDYHRRDSLDFKTFFISLHFVKVGNRELLRVWPPPLKMAYRVPGSLFSKQACSH